MRSFYLGNVFVKKSSVFRHAPAAGKSKVSWGFTAVPKKLYLRFCLTKIDDWNGELFLLNR